MTLDDAVAERDRVATRFTWRATQGPGLGARVAHGGAIMRFDDGQIAECWNLPAEICASRLPALVSPGDGEILAAVAAEQDAMAELLAELVAAPTVLGHEASGPGRHAAGVRGLGLEPLDVPLEPAALERHPAGAPFSWDVDGKTNVLATWARRAPPTAAR